MPPFLSPPRPATCRQKLARRPAPCFRGPAAFFAAAALLAMLGGQSARADESAATSYLKGLDELAAGNWPAAVADFGKCLDADEENTDYLTAHGVAVLLSGKLKFPAGVKELQRSLRINPSNWETKLWL